MRHILFLLAAVVLASAAFAQCVDDLYKVSPEASSTCCAMFKGTRIEPGKEFVLADIEGPGKITFWYIIGCPLRGKALSFLSSTTSRGVAPG